MRYTFLQADRDAPHLLVNLTKHITEDNEVVPDRRRLLFNGLCEDELEVFDETIARLIIAIDELGTTSSSGIRVDWHRAIVGHGTQLLLSTPDGSVFPESFDSFILEIVRHAVPADKLVDTAHMTLMHLADWTDPPTR